MISYSLTPEEEQNKQNKWEWYYAWYPTKVGFDKDNRIVTVYKEKYQGRHSLFGIPQERQLPGITIKTWDLWREDCQTGRGYY